MSHDVLAPHRVAIYAAPAPGTDWWERGSEWLGRCASRRCALPMPEIAGVDPVVQTAVTADPQPVQGCQVLPLGTLRYRALASPAFMQRHFAQGVNATTLAQAPMLVFNRKDALQARFVSRITRRKLAPPVHWLPEAHAFVKATRASLGWGMTPDPLVKDDLTTGALVELIANKPVDVPLYWQCWRLNVQALQHVTQAVQRAAALTLLR